MEDCEEVAYLEIALPDMTPDIGVFEGSFKRVKAHTWRHGLASRNFHERWLR